MATAESSRRILKPSKWFSKKSSSSLHRTSLTALNLSTTPTTTRDTENEAMRRLLVPRRSSRLIQDLDSDGDHLLDFEDFMKLMSMNNDDDLRKAFEMFAWEKENTEVSSSSSGISPRRVCNGCCSDLVLKAHI
ncbi:EF hand calcium-binding family protein [Arachis hypogaea]|nr:EF hand calcium-binding family protein [Arachis hypogaea]